MAEENHPLAKRMKLNKIIFNANGLGKKNIAQLSLKT
jgi:hypothetical protein